MRKTLKILVAIGSVILIFLSVKFIANYSGASPGNHYPATPSFSQEANEIFASTIGKNVDLNSGISLQRATPLNPDQSNNITFVVLNHTDEPIVFANQGFGLLVFRYDDAKKDWERLQLQHVPYSEPKILPPQLENWNLEINNSWDILENDTTALGYEHIRLYVFGKGTITNKTYGSYLDVTISASP